MINRHYPQHASQNAYSWRYLLNYTRKAETATAIAGATRKIYLKIG